MAIQPQPLFDTYPNFLALNFNGLSAENPLVVEYLAGFHPGLNALEGYQAVRSFLKSYAGNETTFNSYRTNIERLLLWSLIVRRRPLLELQRVDAEAYMEFCLNPPSAWIGPVVRGRFMASAQTAESISSQKVNPNWRPLCTSTPKRQRKIADETGVEPPKPKFAMSQATVASTFSVCSSFFEFAIVEGMNALNPFRAIRQKSSYRQRLATDSTNRALTPLQWDYVLETAETMAVEEPERHERTLFITATLFSMYLRISDLVGRSNWKPCMGDFRQDGHGNWWLHVVGKGNKSAKIGVRDDYLSYLVRYRGYLNLPPLPSPGETTPLLASFQGRPGLSDRYVRALMQQVFDRALAG
ncbi:Site-specific recombinase, phage integrase family [Pseudomonas coronafaciens pv. zizaniae]|nr:Site-specific recombinase, phage integrase family [Pseudomonas coronafaciens pv. zizaniae]